MERFPVAILGIPIQNATTEEIIQKCLSCIEQYHKDHRPRYFSTINSDFLIQAHSWSCRSVRHPELLKIYRESALATADGMPLLWISRMLGSPIRERITGKDLFLPLVQALGKQEKAVFLLGGLQKIVKAAAVHLHNIAPHLRIVGIATPRIYFEGENLENAKEMDALLIEQINAAHPHLLAINLGNPKQELWFERVRHFLHVPLSIGVGGTLDAIGGVFARPPKWMQKVGLEWLYRLFQEPKRLWKRYLLDLFKLSYISLPLIIYHNYNRLLSSMSYSGKQVVSLKKSLLFLSPAKSLVVILLPKLLNASNVLDYFQCFEEASSQDAIILDFKNVRHIQPEGFSLLIHIWLYRQREKKEIYGLAPTKRIQRLMLFHRVWDLLKEEICRTPEELVARLDHDGKGANVPAFYEALNQEKNSVIISFFGALDNAQDYESYLNKLTPILSQKSCILNFSYCTYIDNTGFMFLLGIRKLMRQQGYSLKLFFLNQGVSRQFRLAKVIHLFDIIR
jgi:N-acetylglucosaminyldiphosphoundecaprenol N-acetyl-beta-D-mannosaminyltransferase